MVIQLPDTPRHEDYEDFVAACLIAFGYSLESNLVLRRHSADVLELDMIATPANDPLNGVLLVDAKSGAAGFTDLFKMRGWMDYVNISLGLLVRAKPPNESNRPALEDIQRKINVSVLTLSLKHLDYDNFVSPATELDDDDRTTLLVSAWWGRIAQRICLKEYIAYVRSDPPPTCAASCRSYRSSIVNALFARLPIARVDRLYDAYKASPNLTGHCVDDMADGDDDEAQTLWTNIRDTEHHLELQYVMMMEITARLGIIKNALLHTVSRKSRASKKRGRLRWDRLLERIVPASFQEGLKALERHEYRDRIPFLFQVFIEVFGGFYGVHNGKDRRILAAYTGVPIEEIDGCLALFNKFFPTGNGWYMTAKDELCMMKHIPAVYRGTGAFLRSRCHDEERYDKIYPKMGWLVQKWHNALYRALKPHIGVRSSRKKAKKRT